MNKFIIIQSNIPIADLGHIEIIYCNDNVSSIKQKIIKLHDAMLAQFNLLKMWQQQGGVLTSEQCEQLLQHQPIITAYFTRCELYRFTENVSSMNELSKEFDQYAKSVTKAIALAEDFTQVDDDIIPWIQDKFMDSSV